MKACNFSKREQGKRLLIMLLGNICAISLFVTTPVAGGDETTTQTIEYVSVFEAYEYNGELPELSKQLTPGNSLMAPKSQLASAHFNVVKATRHKG